MKLPRRQFLHLAAAAAALPAPPDADTKTPPGWRQGRSLAGTLASLSGRWAPLGKRMGRARSFSLPQLFAKAAIAVSRVSA